MDGVETSINDHEYAFLLINACRFLTFVLSRIFWFGDLNYRIDLPDAEVRQKIAEQDWGYLLAADQVSVVDNHVVVLSGIQ